MLFVIKGRTIGGHHRVQKKITARVDLTFLIVILCFWGCAANVCESSAEGKSATERHERSFSSEEYDKLLTKAQKTGSIRIIARLNMPFVPEGRLSAQEAVDQQNRIARLQDQLCGALSGYPIKDIRRFKYTPYIAMTVDSEALKALTASALILSMEEDVPAGH